MCLLSQKGLKRYTYLFMRKQIPSSVLAEKINPCFRYYKVPEFIQWSALICRHLPYAHKLPELQGATKAHPGECSPITRSQQMSLLH